MQQMKTSLLCVLLLGLGLALAGNSGEHFKPGSGFKPDEQDRFDECQPLVSHDGCKCSGESHSGSHEVVTKEPGSTVSPGSTASPGSTPAASSISPAPGSGEWDEGDYCFLFQAFLNFSIELDVEIKEIFIAWINISQVEIVEDKNLTDYEKIVKIWYSLQILFSEYSEIEVKIKYKHIPFWGFVCNLKDLVIHIQSKTTIVTKEEVIEESGGSCPLTKSLKKCESNLTTSESGEVDILITDIDTISKGKGMFSKKMADIYKKFKAFYGKNPHLKSKISECEIDGFGIVGSYYDISQTYWHIEYFKVAVGGSADDTNCKLLKTLYKLYSNTTLDFSMRNDMKELHDKLQVYYAANVSVEFRIQYFAEQLYELLILAQWDIGLLYSAQIEGFDGDCADLILAWVYCEDNDVSSEEFTTVEASTSTTTTTTTSTTTAKPTTTVPQGDCSTVFGVNVFTANITILLSSIDKAQQSWSSGNVTQFSGYKLRIYNYSKNITLTDSQKFNSIKTVFTGFAGSATLKQMVMSIFINGWGTVTQYCACNK